MLHSVVALEEAAAALLANPEIGIMGAVGVDSAGRVIGRIRDRVVQIGEPAVEPRDVDSLDEVLFLIRRDQLAAEPLSEDPHLAWHAYCVEYGARMRLLGKRTVARDIPPLTHNSLTTNLKDLDLAHLKVGRSYPPDLLPLETTCGTIRAVSEQRRLPPRLVQRVRDAHVWWTESIQARALARVSPKSEVVIADVRQLIDRALDRGEMDSLRVLDLQGPPDLVVAEAADLIRFHRPSRSRPPRSMPPVPRSRAGVTTNCS